MLKSLRSGSQSFLVKIFLFAFLFMALAGLVVMDVQGMFRGGISDNAVAKIGSKKITAPDFEHMVSTALQQQQIPRDIGLLMGIPRQVLTQEINARVFGLAASDMGLIPDDAAAAKMLQEILDPYVKDGMSHEQALERFLYSTGMSEPQLVATLKARLAVSTLTGLLTAGARPPKILVDDSVKFNYEQRAADYFTIGPADAGATPAPTEEQLKEYFKTAGAQFALPEYRTLNVLVLDTVALGLEQKIDEDAIKTHYEARKADFTTPETRVIEQVVTDDEETAKAVRAAAVSGGDLKKAAETASGGKKANYLEAEKLAELEMPAELSPAAFAAEEGAFPEPVKTPFGWHVLHVKKINPGHVEPLDSVREKIREALTSSQAASALYEEANKIDDILAGGGILDDVAMQYSLKPVTLEKVAADGTAADKSQPGKDLPEIEKIIEEGFRLQEGETGQLIETPAGSFVLVSAREIIPSTAPPFESVRAKVAEAWKKRETGLAVQRRADEIAARLKNHEPFAKVAAAFGKKPASTGLVARTADPKKTDFDPAIKTALFRMEREGNTTVVEGRDGKHIVLLYTKRQLGDPAKKGEEDVSALAAALERSMQETILNEYRAVLVDKYDVSVNDALLAEMYAPKEPGAVETP